MIRSNNPDYDRNKPKYEWGGKWRGKPPSEKQINYAEMLAEKNQVRINWEELTRGDVSFLIDDLKMGYRRGFGLFKKHWIDTDKVADLQEA